MDHKSSQSSDLTQNVEESVLDNVPHSDVPEEHSSFWGGLIGAFLGMLAGAIVWALIGMLGRISVAGGVVMGFTIVFGYTKLHGPKGAVGIVIFLVMMVAGVLLGNLLAMVPTIHEFFNELPKRVREQVSELEYAVDLIKENFATNPEFTNGFIKDSALGLLLAFLGGFGLLRKK